jgi:16S rRNA (guanine(527)-N(7))-methyltransferase RsmG
MFAVCTHACASWIVAILTFKSEAPFINYDHTMMICNRRYFGLFILIFIVEYIRNKNDNASIEDSGNSVTSVTAVAYVTTSLNINRLSRREGQIMQNNKGMTNLHYFSRNTKQQYQSSFIRRSLLTFLSSPSDSQHDFDTSTDSALESDSDRGSTGIPHAEGASTTIATSSLLSPLIEPTSDMAKELCIDTLQLTQAQYQQILHFVTLIMEWNEHINLISRKECTPSTIFTRHVLPSLVGGCIIREQLLQQRDINKTIRVIDVGTGGGFPGIPLAIQYPNVEFVLADSITKKIATVHDMITKLQLSNVNTYNGRVEEYFAITTTTTTAGATIPKFDIVTGRSVTALPQFCSWIKDLVNEDKGNLVYWIGGQIDEMIQEYIFSNIAIQDHICSSSSIPNVWNDNFDKRVLIVPASGVRAIAALVPESQFQQQLAKSIAEKRRLGLISSPSSPRPRNNSNDNSASSNKLAKGEWRKRNDPDQPKQRGYESFQRYTSSSVSKQKPQSKSETQSGPIAPNE